MLDLAIINALDQIKSPPAVMRSLADIQHNEAPAKLARRFEANLGVAEADFQSWLNEGVAVRADLATVFQSALDASIDPSTFLPKLNERIAQIELAAVRTSDEADELANQLKRQRRRAKQISPEFGRLYASISDRMLTLMERELEERGDFVLFMKSWRARFDHEPVSVAFDDPKKLDAYLRAALAI